MAKKSTTRRLSIVNVKFENRNCRRKNPAGSLKKKHFHLKVLPATQFWLFSL